MSNILRGLTKAAQAATTSGLQSYGDAAKAGKQEYNREQSRRSAGRYQQKQTPQEYNKMKAREMMGMEGEPKDCQACSELSSYKSDGSSQFQRDQKSWIQQARVTMPQRAMVNEIIEKHGVPMFLLLAGAYFLSTSVVNPLVSTAQSFVTDIKNANEVLQTEIAQVDRENLMRWDQSFQLHTEKKLLIEKCLDRLHEMQVTHSELKNEIRNLNTKLELRERSNDATSIQEKVRPSRTDSPAGS